MNKHLDLKTVVLMGRTFDEYYKMFDLDNEFMKNANEMMVIRK